MDIHPDEVAGSLLVLLTFSSNNFDLLVLFPLGRLLPCPSDGILSPTKRKFLR